jgi:RNA polymerase sigma-70 factor (ECF subfamily)
MNEETARDSGIQHLMPIMKVIKSGEDLSKEDVFRDFFEKNKSAVYAVCKHYIPDTQIAEDLTQEAFIKFHQNIQSIRGSAIAFIKTIAANLSIDFWRKKKVQKESLIEEESRIVDKESIEDIGFILATVAESSEKIRQALTLLDEYCRTFLYYLSEGLRLNEISTIVNVTESKIRGDSSRCRRKAIYELCSLEGITFSDQEKLFVKGYFANPYTSKTKALGDLRIGEEDFEQLHRGILEKLYQFYCPE